MTCQTRLVFRFTSGWLTRAITLAEQISDDKEDMMTSVASDLLMTNWLLVFTEASI